MILLYENALLTLQNGQETQNFPPRGGLFSDCFLSYLFLCIRVYTYMYIGKISQNMYIKKVDGHIHIFGFQDMYIYIFF